MRLGRLLMVCVLLATGLVVLPASPVAALDIEVTDCEDDDGFVQALFEVQNEGGGTITFDCGLDPVTITLDGEQVISPTTLGIVIDGGGLVTLSGGNARRLFFVEEDASLDLRNITLSGGNGSGTSPIGRGGAIYNDGGQITITNSTLSGNQAVAFGGAILNDSGQATITGSTLSGNQAEFGGAIYNSGGQATITGSTLSGNQAVAFGGAILNDSGQATITGSTLSGNQAVASGGAIYNFDSGRTTITSSTLSGNQAVAFGGAILNDSGQATITGSTLSGNQAVASGGAIYNFDSGRTTITSSTLSGNDASVGAAILVHVGTTLTLQASIIDGSESEVDACFFESGATLDSQGYNLSTDDSCDLDPTLGDLPDTDPQLAVLADNGGPTQTHLPQPGSPVIDHIPATECATDEGGAILPDQRGVSRPQNGKCDIGSVEVVPYLLCADRATGEVREATDSDCGRREREVSLELDGPHTVCVSRATGGLRVTSVSGECTRTEQVVTLPEDGPITACVHRSTGELRLASNGACTRYEVRREIGGSPPEA